MKHVGSNSKYIFAGGWNQYLYRTSSPQSQWETILDLGDEKDISILSIGDSAIFFSDFTSKIFRSMDNGETWDTLFNKIPSSLFEGGYAGMFESILCNDSEIILTAGDGGVYRSIDYGDSWNDINSNLPTFDITTATLYKNELYVGTFDMGIFYSDDKGDSYKSLGLTDCNIQSITVYEGNLFVGTYRNGLFHSNDNGITWSNIGMKGSIINEIIVSVPNLIVGTGGNGAWIYPVSNFTTNIIEETKKNTNNFELSQNYPNPFNPITKIKYSILSNSYVVLKIYDLLGKEILTLVDETKSIGNYEIEFDASNLASGIYFYKLSVYNRSETKKMLLMK